MKRARESWAVPSPASLEKLVLATCVQAASVGPSGGTDSSWCLEPGDAGGKVV